MDDGDLRIRVEPLLERGERIRWTGTSSRWSYLPAHIPALVISTVVASLFSWPLIAELLRHDTRGLGVGRVCFAILSAYFLAKSLRSIFHDMDVAWAISDRRVYRITGSRVTGTDICSAVSLEAGPRDRGRGDIEIQMPQTKAVEGDKGYPSIIMRDIDDMQGAHDVLSSIVVGPLRIA